MNKTKLFCSLVFFCTTFGMYAQADYYRERLTLINMLEGTDSLNLQKAVFSVENAWFENRLDNQEFEQTINTYTAFSKMLMQNQDIQYNGKDKENVKAQASVFRFMTDSIPVQFGEKIIYNPPFQYNYEDFAGQKDWRSMFVTTLMATGKGNCHSMPLLYKLIMNQLGEKCWLALAPNHMYLKAYTEQSGLYNLELTTGHHPTDAWIIASGFIHLDAIRNGLYMDTLTVKEEIALCLLDLAQGYNRKYPENDGTFVNECCQTVLKYYPACINARLMQAEIMTRDYLKIDNKESLTAKKLKKEMEQAYTEIHKLGYRKMPEKMYKEWLRNSSAYNEKDPNHKAISYR